MADTINPDHVEQIARYMQARDAQSFGVKTDAGWSPSWEDTGDIGREDYLRDAHAFLAAATVLGYRLTEPDLTPVTRLELIGPGGRLVGLHGVTNVALHLQDDGRTLKVFADAKPTTERTT